MTNKLKQVIVMRTDLNMRKGKMIAQGAHAAMAFMSRNLTHERSEDDLHQFSIFLNDKEQDWLNSSFIKICVGVDSEEALMEIHKQAGANGIASYIMEDNGATEFHGVKTKTCLALGPDYSSNLDPVTGHLKLL